MVNDVISDAKEHMNKTIEAFKRELQTLRTGRANTAVLDGVRVDYYGTPTPIKQLGAVNVPEATQITIQPWDMSALGDIEKAIIKANLGFNPINDGKILRIILPPLTEERRKELVKVAKKMAEDCRVAVRNSRRDANDMVKELEKSRDISEDESKHAHDKVQKLTDEATERINTILKDKEAEILTI